MTTAVQRRRGTTTEHASFTGLEGEISVNTTKETLVVHDGATVGGFELARADGSNFVATSVDINGGTIDGTTIGASSASTGAFTTLTASGEITANGGIALGDNDKATFGAGDDLQLYHNGNNSFIEDVGTGNLYLRAANNIFIEGATANESMATFQENGFVKLFFNNEEKLATTNTGIDVTGTATMDGLTVEGNGALFTLDNGSNAATLSNTNGNVVLDYDAAEAGRSFTVQQNGRKSLRVNNSGDVSFYEDTGTTPKFFWDASAESLTVGGDDSTTATSLNTLVLGEYADASSGAVLRSSAASAINFEDSNASTAGRIYYNHTSDYMAFNTATSERMRLDDSGNLLIGQTTIPTGLGASNTKLIMGSFEDAPEFVAYNSDNAIEAGDKIGAYLFGNDDNNATEDHFAGMWAKSAGTTGAMDIHFAAGKSNYEDDSPHMTLDSSGNVGIGVTPESTWDSGFNALQVGSRGALWSATGASGTWLTRNAYYDGTNFKYVATDEASAYEQGPDGSHRWSNASSGTADTTLTLTESMRIDSSGNVGIGTSSPSATLEVDNGAEGEYFIAGGDNASNGRSIRFTSSTSSAGSNGALHTIKANSTAGELAFANGNGNIMYLDSSGRVGIGTANPRALSHVYLTGGGSDDFNTLVTAYRPNSVWEDLNADTTDWQIFVDAGDMQFRYGDASTDTKLTSEAMRIDSSGNLLVGTTVAAGKVTINSPSNDGLNVSTGADRLVMISKRGNDGGHIRFQNSAGTTAGNINVTGTTTTYTSVSDERLKENITDADDAGSKIDAIQVRQYDWKVDGSHQDYGMIAQELQAVAPEAVSGDADSEEMMGVDYSKLVPMLIKEIQSLRNRVAQLEE